MQTVLFINSFPLHNLTSHRHRVPHKCPCPKWTSNINKTSDPSREDEIASQIASLRKQKRLQSQSANAPSSDASPPKDKDASAAGEVSPPTSPSQNPDDGIASRSIFNELPDWKKEELLAQQMNEAESFFNRGVLFDNDSVVDVSDTLLSPIPVPPSQLTPSPLVPPAVRDSDDSSAADAPNIPPPPVPIPPEQSAPSPLAPPAESEGAPQPKTDRGETTDQSDYKPKVSTWGVFPRPDNISRTYGGGRGIQRGGNPLNTEAMRKRDEAIKERLAAYRASLGLDLAKEEENREAIEGALDKADLYLRRAAPYDAIAQLEGFVDILSERSRLGGRTLLTLALAYDATGRRDDAKNLYLQLRGSPFVEISSKAKQLLQGFSAMEELNVPDEARGRGLTVTDFKLPDVNYASEKRYETAIFGSRDVDESQQAERVGLGTNLALFALMVAPALLIAFLVATRSK